MSKLTAKSGQKSVIRLILTDNNKMCDRVKWALFMANIGADDGSQKLIVLKIMIIINSQNLGFVQNISGQLNLEMF